MFLKYFITILVSAIVLQFALRTIYKPTTVPFIKESIIELVVEVKGNNNLPVKGALITLTRPVYKILGKSDSKGRLTVSFNTQIGKSHTLLVEGKTFKITKYLAPVTKLKEKRYIRLTPIEISLGYATLEKRKIVPIKIIRPKEKPAKEREVQLIWKVKESEKKDCSYSYVNSLVSKFWLKNKLQLKERGFLQVYFIAHNQDKPYWEVLGKGKSDRYIGGMLLKADRIDEDSIKWVFHNLYPEFHHKSDLLGKIYVPKRKDEGLRAYLNGRFLSFQSEEKYHIFSVDKHQSSGDIASLALVNDKLFARSLVMTAQLKNNYYILENRLSSNKYRRQ